MTGFFATTGIPRSKAGVKSTSLGIIPLVINERSPVVKSCSVITGGAANGFFRNSLDKIFGGGCSKCAGCAG